jgi:hypothetical protein
MYCPKLNIYLDFENLAASRVRPVGLPTWETIPFRNSREFAGCFGGLTWLRFYLLRGERLAQLVRERAHREGFLQEQDV